MAVQRAPRTLGGIAEDRYRDRVDAVEMAWSCWANTGRSLDTDGWRAPSRCDGWDVAALFAHLGMFPGAVLNAPAPPGQPGTPATAAQILAGFNTLGGVADEMAAAVADMTVAGARDAGPDALVAAFGETGPRAVAQLRAHPPDGLVPWPAAEEVTTWG